MAAEVRPVLRAVATALATGRLRLDPGADRDEAERTLRAVPGVGARTASAIRMRALGDPDVLLLPGSAPSPHWGPWRTYATHHVWASTLREAH